MARLQGKVALITGGASGIGAAAALSMVGQGARVTVTDLNDDLGESLEQGVDGLDFRHHDVREETQWRQIVADIVGRYGRIDILVNNAGLVRPGSIEALEYEDFRLQIDVMLGGTALGCKTVIPQMARQGGGSIINVASIGAIKGIGNIPAYTAAKGGVVAMTRSIAVHCLDAGHDIRVNAIAPGGIDTPLLTQFSASGAGSAQDGQTSGGLARGRADDVAHLIVFLASDESSHITGTLIPIDRGAAGR